MASNPTESEKYLAKLAKKSFLKLWVYPSPYNRKGKELCDLLVIFGNYVLIFSDKEITWPEKDDLNLCWTRWYNHAVKESVEQVNGAIRYISKFPNEIYFDQKCTKPIPILLPPKENRKIIGILVANGTKEACREFFKGGSGSMLVKPYLTGDDHTKQNKGFNFFSIGDVNPEGDFIHVFNEVTLDIIMKELDTITDFITYLGKKADFIRSGILFSAHGEEDLLAWYITHTNDRGEHAFVRPGHTTRQFSKR